MACPSVVPDLETLRACFPALASETVFLENAGGSQIPESVAERIHDYLVRSYVQLGADYALSKRCTRIVEEAHEFVRLFMNGDGIGEVVLGPSFSALCLMLANALASRIRPGDEIVVAESGHEANIGPWLKLAASGATIRWWPVERPSGRSTLEGLSSVLNERTRIVAFPHVSNLLGEIVDVKQATRLAHEAGAIVVVDGVAYAPHRAIDVADWGVDWYAYSTYKVYGPHMGALFGRHEAFEGLPGPNHFFVADDDIPYKFELGGVNHEGCAGLLGLADYLCFLAGDDELSRDTVTRAADVMEACEKPLQERLIQYLRDHPRARIVGPEHAETERVGTISFVHTETSSREIALAANERGFGIRHGHMYAWRLCEAMGLDPEDGVVRVSFVHYNTLDEIERLIALFDHLL